MPAPPPPPSMASSLGMPVQVMNCQSMPVQVFPTGPPPPPPVPTKAQLAPNGTRSPSVSRKSPGPQSFEPPPLGCRPEIKIPPNPMAALKKVPDSQKSKPKEDFWLEEYRKERSKSPMPDAPSSNQQQNAFTNGRNDVPLPEPVHQLNYNQPSSKVDSPVHFHVANLRRQPSQNDNNNSHPSSPDCNNNNVSSYNNVNSPNSPQHRIYSPFSTSSPVPNLPKPLTPEKLNNQDENVPIYVRSFQRGASPKPTTPQPNQSSVQPQHQVRQSPAFLQEQPSLEQQYQQTPVYSRPSRNVTASPVVQNQPNQQQTENVPIYVRSFQKQPAPPSPLAQQQQPLTTTNQVYNNEPGRQYYQPNRVISPPTQPPQQQQTSNNNNVPLASQQVPAWMRRQNSKELPEWANDQSSIANNVNASLNGTQNYAGPTVIDIKLFF